MLCRRFFKWKHCPGGYLLEFLSTPLSCHPELGILPDVNWFIHLHILHLVVSQVSQILLEYLLFFVLAVCLYLHKEHTGD